MEDFCDTNNIIYKVYVDEMEIQILEVIHIAVRCGRAIADCSLFRITQRQIR